MNQDAPNLHEFDLSGNNGIYKLAWPQIHVKAHIDRIKESSDHEVKAEVKLTSARPTSSGHLRSGRVNLTSPASRNSFAKSLAARDSEVDWDTVMEQLCMAVLEDWRQGSPLGELDGNMDVQAQAKWLIEPIIQLNNPTLIYGPGSTGKSFFAQFIAVIADAGMNSAGLHVEPSNVLYLDWETDQTEIGSRVTMIRRGLGIEGASHILYRPMTQGLATDIERIREICLDHSIDLVIVDSLGSACMGEPESAEVVLRAFGAIRSLGVSALCVDHTNKEGHLFGSVYKFNSARQVFEAKKDQQADADKVEFGLFHKKANNSKLLKPLGFELSFSEDSIAIVRRDVKDTALEEHMRVIDRIANALSKVGKLTVLQIAEEIQKEESHVRKELSNGKRSGRFMQLEGGYWALPAREIEQTVTKIYEQEMEGEV